MVWDSDGKGGVGGDDASKVDEGDDEETRPKVPYSVSQINAHVLLIRCTTR